MRRRERERRRGEVERDAQFYKIYFLRQDPHALETVHICVIGFDLDARVIQEQTELLVQVGDLGAVEGHEVVGIAHPARPVPE